MLCRDYTIANKLLLFFLFFPVLSGFGQESSSDKPGPLLPEEEAPTSLLEAELGDADVDLFLEGTWKSSLSGGFGWSRDNRSKETRFSTFPGMTDGFTFNQVPELTLSLWLIDRYFFETTITEEEQLETFLFGYNGKEGELLQQVRVGNTDLGRGSFGFLSLPEASKDSFGAYGLLQSESTEHHLALRFDPAGKETVHYRGHNIIEEQRIDPAETVNGRFFILPDKDIDSITVYMEDGDGSVTGTPVGGSTTSFRKLQDDEVTISRAEGLVFLSEPARGKVVVYYEVDGVPVGDPNDESTSVGADALCGTSTNASGTKILDLAEGKIDFYWDNPDIDGTNSLYLGQNLNNRKTALSDQAEDGLILYRPGQWSPFELRSVYELEGAAEGSGGSDKPPLRLVPKGGTEGSPLSYTSFEEGLARITGGGEIRSHESRYPLLSDLGEDEILYGPNRAESPQPVGKELLYEEKSPVNSFNLGSDVLEGSIEIKRNGVPEHRYSFNPDNGEIHFFVPVSHSERIDISYRAAGSGFTEGELIAASANSIEFSENLSGSLNLGLRWNITDAAYTEETNQAQGSVLMAGGSSWETENFRLSLDGGLSVESPDTTGLRRFLGMDGGGVPVAFTLETLYPGAPGDYSVTNTVAGLTEGPDLVHPKARGKLFYSEMYSRSFTGDYQLQHYNWEPPADQVYDYGERVGPYPAATGSETEGDAMVMEYKLDPGQWAGGLVPLVNGEDPLDLSRMKAVTFRMKHIGREPGSETEGDVDIYLIFGRLPEDLDNDEKLDEENSRYSDGFSFNHSDHGTMPVAPYLPWAPEQSMRNSEDLDGNGVLDSYPQGDVTVVKHAPADGTDGDFDPLDSGSWNHVTLSLSAEERRRLTAVSAVQVVVVESGSAANASGRLLVSELSFLGSSFAKSEGEVEVYEETLQKSSAETGGDYDGLIDYEEADLFNDAGDGRARVSAFDYSSASAEATWRARAYGKPVDIGDYGKLSFFMKADDTVDEVSLSVRNPAGDGLAVRFEPDGSAAPGTWSRYTWELDSSGSSKVTKDGKELTSYPGDYSDPPATPTKKRNAEGVNRIDIAVDHTGSAEPDAPLKLDEIYFHDPRMEIAGAGRSQLTYHRPGVLVGSDERPIIHDVTYENQVQLQNRNFASGFIEPVGGELNFSNNLSLGLLEGSAELSYSGYLDRSKLYPSGGYDFTLPFFGAALTINEAYRENHTHSTVEVDHSSSLDIRLNNAGSLYLSSDLSRDSRSLIRDWRWRGSLSPPAGPSLTLSGNYGAENLEEESEERLMPIGSLPGRYSSSFALYLPEHTRGKISRNTGHEVQLSGKISETAIDFSARLNTAGEAEEDPLSLTEHHEFGLTARSRLAPESSGDPTLSLSYTRALETEDAHDHPETGDFADDLAEALGRSRNQLYFWNSLPLTELWSDVTRSNFTEDSEDLDYAGYTPSISAGFSLTPGSLLRNLILPTNLEAKASRDLSRSYDSGTDALSLDGSYRATALNLFGTLGRYSLFSWYRTEEITHSAALTSRIPLSTAMSEESESYTLTFGQFLELQIDQRISVTGNTKFILDLPQRTKELTVETGWNRRRPYEKNFPFKDRLDIEETPDLAHEETFDVHWKENPPEESRNIRFLFSHTTSLVLGDRGEARAFGRLGYERSAVEDEGDEQGEFIVYTFGGEVGLEIKLTF
ncbi:MAG: hypothetical protein R6V67_02980 [Spirochaetia bacterium]